MKKFTLLLLAATLLLHTGLLAQRGTIVNAVPVASLTPAQIMQNLQLNMDQTSFALINYFTYKKYDVNAVKIIYNTIDGKGNPTIASGVVFLPAVQNETAVPVFSYLHGTLTKDLDAPSYLAGIESTIGWIMSMDGYISVLPDYLGLGDGPGVHLYSHANSEASASIDLLKAANLFCLNPLVLAKPNGNLYLCGYSQGAHAALATQQELEKNPIPNLTLQKTVAGSGAYSLSFIQKNFLFDNPTYPNPSFLPYLLLGYQDVYGNLYSNLSQVFVPPYDTQMPGFFNGLLDVDEIDGQLPVNWKSMFVPKYLWNIQYNYFHPVNVDLRKNDLIDWKPKTDLYLYYSLGDELVAKENSMLAYLSFRLKGFRNVTCLPVGNLTHAATAPYVLLLAKLQFDCASGINPCGLDLPLLASQTKSASLVDLSMFKTALNENATLDLKEIYSNKAIASYLEGKPFNEEQWSIYPNPANDRVNIQIFDKLSMNGRLSIYDMQGRLIQDKIITENDVIMNVKSLKTGVYKIVLNGDFTDTKSLIIAR
jgi:hypothetical protein